LGVVAAAKSVARARVFRRRIEAACCGVCGYDLIGNVSGVCPECGKRVTCKCERGVVE